MALTFAAKEDEFLANETDDTWESYGGRNRGGYANQLSYLDRTLTVWAVHGLLTGLEGQLAALRNRVAAVSLTNVSRAVTELESAQRDLLTVARDAVPLASMLKHFCAEAALFHVEVYEFLVANPTRSNESPLFEGLREALSRRAGLLQELERDVRDAATSQGSLVATMAQNRATKTIIRLSLAVSALTAVLVALTVLLLLQQG
jgi:hypothetical protein